MCPPFLFVFGGRLYESDPSGQIGQLGENIIGSGAVDRRGKTDRIDPSGVHSEPFCADDIIFKTVPDEETLGGSNPDLLAGGEEDFGARLSDSDFGGDDHRVKEGGDPFSL